MKNTMVLAIRMAWLVMKSPLVPVWQPFVMYTILYGVFDLTKNRFPMRKQSRSSKGTHFDPILTTAFETASEFAAVWDQYGEYQNPNVHHGDFRCLFLNIFVKELLQSMASAFEEHFWGELCVTSQLLFLFYFPTIWLQTYAARSLLGLRSIPKAGVFLYAKLHHVFVRDVLVYLDPILLSCSLHIGLRAPFQSQSVPRELWWPFYLRFISQMEITLVPLVLALLGHSMVETVPPFLS